MFGEYKSFWKLITYSSIYGANNGSRLCMMAWAWAPARRNGLIVVALIMLPLGHLGQRQYGDGDHGASVE